MPVCRIDVIRRRAVTVIVGCAEHLCGSSRTKMHGVRIGRACCRAAQEAAQVCRDSRKKSISSCLD